ncbi:hypothetical protein NO113_20275, partial [Clostridioides difficile]|nr:hypothetical protein [Clostridioides difficile]
MLNGSIWRNPAYFTLGSSGPWRALGRWRDLLASFDLPATCFVPAWIAQTWPAQCAAIVERG